MRVKFSNEERWYLAQMMMIQSPGKTYEDRRKWKRAMNQLGLEELWDSTPEVKKDGETVREMNEDIKKLQATWEINVENAETFLKTFERDMAGKLLRDLFPLEEKLHQVKDGNYQLPEETQAAGGDGVKSNMTEEARQA